MFQSCTVDQQFWDQIVEMTYQTLIWQAVTANLSWPCLTYIGSYSLSLKTMIDTGSYSKELVTWRQSLNTMFDTGSWLLKTMFDTGSYRLKLTETRRSEFTFSWPFPKNLQSGHFFQPWPDESKQDIKTWAVKVYWTGFKWCKKSK